MAAKNLRVYSVTQEGMTTYFAARRDARHFDDEHDECAGVVTHNYDAAQLAELLNGECPSSNGGANGQQ